MSHTRSSVLHQMSDNERHKERKDHGETDERESAKEEKDGGGDEKMKEKDEGKSSGVDEEKNERNTEDNEEDEEEEDEKFIEPVLDARNVSKILIVLVIPHGSSKHSRWQLSARHHCLRVTYFNFRSLSKRV